MCWSNVLQPGLQVKPMQALALRQLFRLHQLSLPIQTLDTTTAAAVNALHEWEAQQEHLLRTSSGSACKHTHQHAVAIAMPSSRQSTTTADRMEMRECQTLCPYLQQQQGW
jgi:hypothetical protein